MTTIAKPAYLVMLQDLFERTHSEDVSTVCGWLNMPTPEECPTPGQARTWGKAEWGDWADKNGFEYEGEQTHSWIWKHTVVKKLVVNVAKTPGDWRTPMAIATQTRRQVRTIATAVNAIMRNMAGIASATTDMVQELWSKTEEFIKDDVITQAYGRNDPGQHGDVIYRTMLANTKRNTQDHKTVGQLLTLLNRCNEFGRTPRQVMIEIMGPEQGAREYDAIKLADPTLPTSMEVYEEAKDQLELLKETERAEKDRKRAEREAKDVAEAAAKAEKTRPRTAQELAQTQIDVVHNANLKTLDGVQQAAETAMRQAGSVLDRVRLARSSLAKATITGIEDVGALKAELAQKGLENDLLAIEVAALKTSIADMIGKTNEVNADRVAKLTNDKTHLKAVVAMVIDSVKAAQTANPFQMVDILNTLSNDAQEALKHHG